MGIIGGEIGYRLLRRFNPPGANSHEAEDSRPEESDLEQKFGAHVWDHIRDKTVIDFGCGLGNDAIVMAQHGARKVIGLDIRENVLETARRAAERAGVADRCFFATSTAEKADVIFSIDAFEHFAQPEEILRLMSRLLREDGAALIAFGPTWYHPLGGHLFSAFPWAHLIFTERALLRWRKDFRDHGATRFAEVEGGLNQMTVRRFQEMVERSDFRFADFEAVPIRKLRPLANSLTREFCTSFVRCRLVPRRAGNNIA